MPGGFISAGHFVIMGAWLSRAGTRFNENRIELALEFDLSDKRPTRWLFYASAADE